MTTVLDTPEQIDMFTFLSRKGALKFEILGLKRSGKSVYSIIKQEYGFKGSRESVLKQMEEIIKQMKEGAL